MNIVARSEFADRPARAAGRNSTSNAWAPAIVRAICCASLLVASTARADSLQDLLEGPVEPLSQAYLECNELALQRLLGQGEAAECSMVYEAVKRRVFDGDFERLIAWSRTASLEKQGKVARQ